ncbi:MAG: HAMP domain-containing protein, partial [Anaerolineae bacterium]|nr:HAMP domain-containing protein [Anaerolineae bacterium]
MTDTSAPQPVAEKTIPLWRKLQWNLILSFVLLAAPPAIIALIFTFTQFERHARQQMLDQLQLVAASKIGRINLWLDDAQATLTLLNEALATSDAMFSLKGNPSSEKPPEDVDPRLNQWLMTAAATQKTFTEFFIYTSNGQIVASSDPAQIGKPIVSQLVHDHSVHNSGLQMWLSKDDPANLQMILVQPINLNTQPDRMVAVLAGRLGTDFLEHVFGEPTGLRSEGEVYLVNTKYEFIIPPRRTPDSPGPQIQNLESLGINQVLQGKRGFGTYPNYRNPPLNVLGVFHWLPALQAGLVVEIPETVVLSSIRFVRNVNFIVLAIFALAALVFSFFVASYITNPLSLLSQITARVANGDLSQRIALTRSDEIGVLATRFNDMTEQLQQIMMGLDNSRQLAKNQANKLIKNAYQLRTVADVSERLNSILDPERLLREVVTLIQDRFDLALVEVYLLVDNENNLVIKTSLSTLTSEPANKTPPVIDYPSTQEGMMISLFSEQSLIAQAARARKTMISEEG